MLNYLILSLSELSVDVELSLVRRSYQERYPYSLPKGLRKFTEEDVPSMLEIFNQIAELDTSTVFLRGMCIGEFGSYLDRYKNDGMPIYVLERQNRILGWLLISRFNWGGQICTNIGEVSIYVPKKKYGLGVAARLALASVILGRQFNMQMLVSWVVGKNYTSQAIASTFGFTLWYRLPKSPGFYEQRADVLLYGLAL